MTTPTTAEQTEPAIKWAQSLLHHAAFPDPVSMYCAIPAHSVEAAARYLASVERENEDARATIARLEGELEVERMRLAACAVAARGGEVRDILPPYDSDSLRAVVALRTRADAAERRVEAVTSDAAVDAAARALCDGFRVVHIDGEDYQWFDNCTEEGKNVWRGLAKLTIAGALAAASGAADGASTTEG